MSRARRERRAQKWRRYQRACDDLGGVQWRYRIGHPIRVTPGWFRRVEGWRAWRGSWG